MSAYDDLAQALKPVNTAKQVADVSGVPESTLAYWRTLGIGPRFTKIGRRVMYPREEIVSYFKQHLYQVTSEYQGDTV